MACRWLCNCDYKIQWLPQVPRQNQLIFSKWKHASRYIAKLQITNSHSPCFLGLVAAHPWNTCNPLAYHYQRQKPDHRCFLLLPFFPFYFCLIWKQWEYIGKHQLEKRRGRAGGCIPNVSRVYIGAKRPNKNGSKKVNGLQYKQLNKTWPQMLSMMLSW